MVCGQIIPACVSNNFVKSLAVARNFATLVEYKICLKDLIIYSFDDGAFCSGSYICNFGSQSLDQTGVGELSNLALQDLIHAMHLEFAVCNLGESKRVRDTSVCINIYGNLLQKLR